MRWEKVVKGGIGRRIRDEKEGIVKEKGEKGKSDSGKLRRWRGEEKEEKCQGKEVRKEKERTAGNLEDEEEEKTEDGAGGG